jgi:primosomal protein N'
MFIEVIPKNSSFSVRPLTYAVGDAFRERIKIGCLVHIPIGKKEDIGIVVSLKSSWYTGDVRQILSVITENQVLAPYQCELIKHIGNRYLMRSNKLFSLFIPSPLYKKLELGWFSLNSSLSIKKERNFDYCVTREGIIQKDYIFSLLTPQTVVVCPDDFMLYSLEKEFKKRLDKSVFLANEVSDTKKARIWMEIQNGKYREIFWTRRILYYNLESYNQILYLEDAFGRKQYQYPTYINNLEVLRFLQEHSHFSIKILSSIPSLESMKLFSSEEITYI